MSEPVRPPVRKEIQVIGESTDYLYVRQHFQAVRFLVSGVQPPRNSAEQQKKATQSGVAFFISLLLNPRNRCPALAEIRGAVLGPNSPPADGNQSTEATEH